MVEFLAKYCAIGSSWPGVDLRFCPWLILFKYWAGGSDLHDLFSVPLVCINKRKLSSDQEPTEICGESNWREGGNKKPRLRSKDLWLNTSEVVFLVLLCSLIYSYSLTYCNIHTVVVMMLLVRRKLSLIHWPSPEMHRMVTERRGRVTPICAIFSQNMSMDRTAAPCNSGKA